MRYLKYIPLDIGPNNLLKHYEKRHFSHHIHSWFMGRKKCIFFHVEYNSNSVLNTHIFIFKFLKWNLNTNKIQNMLCDSADYYYYL